MKEIALTNCSTATSLEAQEQTKNGAGQSCNLLRLLRHKGQMAVCVMLSKLMGQRPCIAVIKPHAAPGCSRGEK